MIRELEPAWVTLYFQPSTFHIKDVPNPSELICNADGSIYHLHLHPEEVADKIIFVGDQNRVDKVARHLDRVELTRQHREFRTITGELQGQRLTILSTGIGPDNIDIVWHELDALANLDLKTGQVKEQLRSLQVLRLGTCGGVQPDLEVGSLVHSRYAIGGDAVMSYYQPARRTAPGVQALQLTMDSWRAQHLPFFAQPWYAAQCDEALDERITRYFDDILPGITYTATGFYGPQGRALGRLPLAVPNLPELLQDFSFDGLNLLNIEMETATIMALGHALGHRTGAISVILANRMAGVFHPEPAQAIERLIERGLEVVVGH